MVGSWKVAVLVRLASVAIALAGASIVLAPRAQAAPATFTVNALGDAGDVDQGDGICETSNPGECTFRAAIEEANANVGADSVHFMIPGSGIQTIEVASMIQVTEQIAIDGYTQPGASQNTNPSPLPLNSVIRIELKWVGSGASSLLSIESSAPGSTVKGVAVYGAQTAIRLWADDSTIRGCYINTDASGLVNPDAGSSTRGVTGVYTMGVNIQLGGVAAADRNIMTNSHANGLSADVGGGIAIYGNYIGIGRDGIADLDGVYGVQAQTGVIIGGSVSAQRNVISGLSNSAVILLGNNNLVQGNYIGTDYSGAVHSGISNGLGVTLAMNNEGNLVGGTSAGEGNVIRGMSGAAISPMKLVLQEYNMEITPNKAAFLGNIISDVKVFDYPGFGTANMGIDLFETIVYSGFLPGDESDEFLQRGVTPNDSGDSDSGPNNYINFPVLKSAVQDGNQLTIMYDLDAADSPTNTYRVEFCANSQSTIFYAGPCETYLGAANAVTPGTNKTITLTVSSDLYQKALSATTTAVDSTTLYGYGSTSEFSINIGIGNTADFDADGIADTIEDSAPNSGDGNDDGIFDKYQPTVTSFEIGSTGTWETFVTTGCSDNGSVTSLDVSSLSVQDDGKIYPFGLTNFTLNCSRGNTVDITKYVFADTQPTSFVLRKYREASASFEDVAGASIASQQIGSAQALVTNYSITDGGYLDDDGEANGVIVDPVGLAISASQNDNALTDSLADTGENIASYMLAMLTLMTVGGGLMLARRRFS